MRFSLVTISSLLVVAISSTVVIVDAWTTSFSIIGTLLTSSHYHPHHRPYGGNYHSSSSSSSTRLFNVPPPSITDKEAFRDYANKQSPPASFFELQQDCIRSTKLAMEDGQLLMEVEFPPLPASVLELDDVSAYDVASANLNLALEYSKGIIASGSSSSNNNNNNNNNKGDAVQRVTILLPDEDEARIAIERLTGTREEYIAPTTEVESGITVSSLRRSDETDDRIIKFEQTFLNLFGGNGDGDNNDKSNNGVQPVNGTDLYICLVSSAQELPDIERLHNQIKDDGIPIILYNLKLDILRGDLGAPAFPSKAFQDRFLSRVKPVYYLRTRQYSRSTSKPPFLVNYQGCLFRAYPGQYQTLLDTGTGSYRRLLGQDKRPALGEFKEQLTQALRDEGVLPQSEGSAFDFLRTGYKTTTWWEDDRENASDAWRT